MGYLNKLLPLLLVGSALGAFEHVPSLPANKRAQFSLQRPDGAFLYGYDTGDGSFHKAESQPGGAAVKGKFGYQDPSGSPIQLEYTADERGFLPKGSHLPKPPPAPLLPAGASPYSAAPLGSPAGGFQDPLANPNADASYKFSFDTPTYNREETSDPKGNIQGKYSFIDPEGKSHQLSFLSGAEKGFVPESADIPRPVPLPAGFPSGAAPAPYPGAGGPAGTLSFSSPNAKYGFPTPGGGAGPLGGAPAPAPYSRGPAGDGSLVSKFSSPSSSYSINAGPSGGMTSVKANIPAMYSYSFDSPAGVPGSPSGSPAAPYSAGPSSGPSPSKTYDFSFDTPTYDRKESSDPSGNVMGSYSFVSPDGKKHNIDYKAGPDTGYVAQGPDIPKSVPAPALPGSPASPYSASPLSSAPRLGPDPGFSSFLPGSGSPKFGYIFN